jgi:hypothetical protein
VRDLTQLAGMLVDDHIIQSLFGDGHSIMLRQNHGVLGNPIRATRGRVGITPDVGWTRGLSRSSRVFVTVATMLMLRHYGYALRQLT